MTGELTTTNYGWIKPTVGDSDDAWGGYLNGDLDGIDTTVKALDTAKLNLTGGVVTGPVDLKVQTVTATTTTAINRANGENVLLQLGMNTAIAVSGWPVSGITGKVRLVVSSSGAFNITSWPSGTIWPAGTPPVITSGAGKKDIILLMSDDAGASIYGSIVGQDYR
jgi:hypothetical protein